MNLTSFLQDKQLTIALRGEIDHHSAKDIMRVVGNKIELYLPRVCVLDFREVTFMDVACFAAQLDPNLEELNDIKTAVSEAVTNCIVHAYRDTIGLVTIRCRILPDSVLDVVVRDKGCGMEDIEKARTPMFTTGGPERSGMGFTIMESFMTSLQVTSKPGRGTTVHMKRKIVQRGKNA